MVILKSTGVFKEVGRNEATKELSHTIDSVGSRGRVRPCPLP